MSDYANDYSLRIQDDVVALAKRINRVRDPEEALHRIVASKPPRRPLTREEGMDLARRMLRGALRSPPPPPSPEAA